MTSGQTVTVAVALGIDCMAVAAAIATTRPSRYITICSVVLFGVFQSLMASAGMFGGQIVATFPESRTRLASPIILGSIGLLMVARGIRSGHKAICVTGLIAMIGASVAVSIDALAAGVALGIVGVLSFAGIAVIGIAASLLSLVGFVAGFVLSRFLNFTQSAGGIILIVLATLCLLHNF